MVIVADENLRKQLNEATAPVELRDPSGKSLGHLLPPKVYDEIAQIAAGEPIMSTAAWQAMIEQRGGRPLVEILARLDQE